MEQLEKLEGVKGFDIQKTKAISPWMLTLQKELGTERRTPLWSFSVRDFSFQLIEGKQSLWVVTRFPSGAEVALRLTYCPDNDLAVEEMLHVDDGIENGNKHEFELRVTTRIGMFHVHLEFPNLEYPLLHSTTKFTPKSSLFIPYWPRDIIVRGQEEDISDSEGTIYTSQVGPRSGVVYFNVLRPRGGSVFYFQNLSALNQYCEQTETSLAEVVGGKWPELGLSLPAALEEPLKGGKDVTVSDAFILFDAKIPRDDLEMSRQYLNALAQIYLCLPRYETEYIHWPDIAKKSLRDLRDSSKCWSTVRTNRYLNAYVGDSETPPESMVQLAVLLPLIEYSEWSKEEIPILEEIREGLPRFFDPQANVYGRWLVSAEHKLDESEPQKKPRVMDSWYLYHSLLNLSRLALRGDKTAERLFLDSMDFATKLAHTFQYNWPVFYDIDTLEVIKAETKEGEGGETDVASLYAHVMIQAWDLTEEKRYLEEAKKAARSLQGLGFRLMYQANSTLFSTGAMLRLWKETEDDLFLNLSYLGLANVFNQMWLWECNYGYAKDYPTFFALFPLKDAEYTAVYEEIEAIAAFHDYMAQMNGQVPEWLNILIPEFLRVLLYKASFYYPPNLPEEAISDESRTGEVDKGLWIPLEDIHDGWEKAGQVGQEVYGSGLAFGVVPRHYIRPADEAFMIYVDYPTIDFRHDDKGKASVRILGDPRLTCHLRLMPTGRSALPRFEVYTEQDGESKIVEGRETEEGHLEYTLFADRTIHINWFNGKRNSRSRKV